MIVLFPISPSQNVLYRKWRSVSEHNNKTWVLPTVASYSAAPEAGLSGHPWPLNPERSTTLPEALTINNDFRTEWVTLRVTQLTSITGVQTSTPLCSQAITSATHKLVRCLATRFCVYIPHLQWGSCQLLFWRGLGPSVLRWGQHFKTKTARLQNYCGLSLKTGCRWELWGVSWPSSIKFVGTLTARNMGNTDQQNKMAVHVYQLPPNMKTNKTEY
jgi:hypothetical protein